MPIPKREATAILGSLAAGVVPRTGLRHIAVGRFREIQALKQDLDRIRDGGATVRFVIGRYGSGKSFLLQLVRLYALESKFVVADADLSPDRRLQGTGGQAIATYRELMRNLSTQLRPDGNALLVIIERWISNVQTAVSAQRGLTPTSLGFAEAVQNEIGQILQNMHELVHGFDFSQVINSYYRGYLSGDETLRSNALRWLRGEFSTKTEARDALGVRNIIDDDNWYDYLKVIARFAHDVGYAGMMIIIDEAVNLYKITNSVSRNNNYERILTIVNDCLQGRSGYFGFLFGGTSEFLEDQRRGLFSYEALRSRLAESRFANSELQSFSEPVLRLAPLSQDEFFVMLQKAREIHREHVPDSRPIDDQGLASSIYGGSLESGRIIAVHHAARDSARFCSADECAS